MGTGSFLGVKSGPGRDGDPSPPSSAVGHKRVEIYLYSPLSAVRPVQSLSRAIPLPPLWAVRPVQSLSRAIPLLPTIGRTACTEPQ